MLDIGIGSIVYSKAGRDKGVCFAVVSLDGEYAYLCDGDIRKFDKPKKKKLKHLSVTNSVSDTVREKMESAGKIGNSELRKAIAQFCENNN